jgi:hypothetical protein
MFPRNQNITTYSIFDIEKKFGNVRNIICKLTFSTSTTLSSDKETFEHEMYKIQFF